MRCLRGCGHPRSSEEESDYRDRYVRDEEHYRKTVRYIENNPVKAGLVKSPEQWRFGSSWWSLCGAEP